MAEGQATFSIDLEGNAKQASAAMAKEIEDLRKRIQGSTESVAGMSKMLRGLRGNSEEVSEAKAKLKARISLEKDAISAANVALLKHGTILKQSAAGSGEMSEALVKGLHHVGGPLAESVSRFGILKEALSESGSKAALGAIGIGIMVAGLAKLAESAVDAAVSLGKWIVVTGDASRNLRLMQEAFAGSAANGANLGSQVDVLSAKLPIAREKINELATGLMRTRLNGQQIVDTMNIVGQASAAMGDDVGKALGDIVKRSAMARRFFLTPQELTALGPNTVRFDAVAGALAKQLNIGINEAKQRLYSGRVDLSAGAKALRTAVEARFGDINAKKLISLGSITQKLKESFQDLTKGVDMDRILGPLSRIANLFSTTTITGKVLQSIITSMGKLLGSGLSDSEGIAKHLFLVLENSFLKLALGILHNRAMLVGMWDAAKASAQGFIDVMGAAISGLGTMLRLAGSVRAGVDKLAGGIANAIPESAIKSLGLGGQTSTLVAPAHADGGTVMQPAPGEAFASVAPGETIIPRGGGMSGGKADIKIHFNISGSGGTEPKNISKELSEPGFLALLTKTIEDACRQAGIPVAPAP